MLAIRHRNAASEMARFLRAGGSINVDGREYLARIDGFAFRLCREEFATSLWAICNRFLEGEYARLDVAGALVVDIGAFIGDSVLEFVRRGAYRVLAYEPIRVNFERAVTNIHLSRAEDRVTLVRAGVAGRSGRQTVHSPNQPSLHFVTLSADGTQPSAAQEGEPVTLVSFADVLRDAVREASNCAIVCKLDCEGAEFDILLGAPLPREFARVGQLMVESHRRSPVPIKAILERQGFVVEVDSRPHPLDGELTMLLAKRRDSPQSVQKVASEAATRSGGIT